MTLSCEEQLRRDILLKALEVLGDTEAAMTAMLQMERFVRSGDRVCVAAGGLSARQDVRENDPCLHPVPPVECPPLASEKGRRRRWSDTEDALLRRLWSDGFTAGAISVQLRRTEASVATRASVLALERATGRPLIRPRGEGRNDDDASPTAPAAIQASDADKVVPRSAEGTPARQVVPSEN